MTLIEEYVKDYGGGFVMTCGTNITAEGGYSDTQIEKILPVKIIGGEPPKKEAEMYRRRRALSVCIREKSQL